jgi:hydroxypyruvate isomerase
MSHNVVTPAKAGIQLLYAASFMAYAFRYATHQDMKLLRSALADEDLIEALENAPPGIIDQQSWSYWHAILGKFPAPTMRKREVFEGRSLGWVEG